MDTLYREIPPVQKNEIRFTGAVFESSKNLLVVQSAEEKIVIVKKDGLL